MSMPGGPSALLARLLAALVSTTLALGVAEVALRLTWDGFYLKASSPYAKPHATRGWHNRPGVQVEYGDPEFSTRLTHDSHGYRSPEIRQERTPGKTRVLVLGDSFAYGIGVEDDETFSARLLRMDPRLEVINTGVSGYGTSQQLLLLREEGLAFAPDVVLVAFFWNDVANSFYREVPRFVLEGRRPRHEPPSEEWRHEVESWKPSPPHRRRLLRHSYLYRFASDRLALGRFQARRWLGTPIERGLRVKPEDQEAAWSLTFALLREIAAATREHGAKIVLVVIPEQAQVQPRTRIEGLEPDDYEVQEKLRTFASAERIAFLDLLPALSAEFRAKGRPLYYLLDRHLNARGHEVTANEVYAFLRDRGVIPREP